MKWLAASCRELLGLGNMDIVDDSYMLRLVACPFFFYMVYVENTNTTIRRLLVFTIRNLLGLP